jgi:NAD(P)-dependent dehydrogenase (short-subunit alcohol dehydrogenase family)
MWTGNLSAKLFKSQPPGEPLQKLNAWLHQEPMITVTVSLYWGLLFLLVAPLVGMIMLYVALVQLVLWCARKYVWPGVSVLEQAKGNAELAVVITGCDSGFGKDLAARLAEKGFFVFAGCLQESSIDLYGGKNGNGNIRPFLLDVTKNSDVAAAAKIVEEWLSSSTSSKRYLHAVVNNAGIGKIGYMDWISMEDYQQCMEVNCFGQIRMTKTFLPIFKRQAICSHTKPFHAPQIINMISMAGTSRGGLALTPYEVSKTAANAFTDGLRLEMKPWGIRVIDINPSFHTTPMTVKVYEKLQKDLWTPLPKELKEEYGQSFFEGYAKHVDRMMSQQWDSNITVDVMVRALLSKNPPAHINVGIDSRFGLLLYSMYPTWMRNLSTQLLMPDQTPAVLRDAKANPSSKKDD